jgi:redox-sensing transcriptional repressor
MKNTIPHPAVIRLCTLYQLLDSLSREGTVQRISSTELGELMDTGAPTIRKDINCLGEIGNVGSGYGVTRLKEHIAERFQIRKPRNTCIVGLGRLGSGVLDYDGFGATPFRIVAAFDTNANRLETIRTSIELFPAFEMAEVVRRKKVELAIIAVPAASAQQTADQLIGAGVKGIVNLTATVIRTATPGVHVINVDVVRELIVLSTLIRLDEAELEEEKE